MLSAVFVALSLLLVLVNAWTCPYAKFTPYHTFCKPPNPSCTNLAHRFPTGRDIQVILDTHNTLRNQIAQGQQFSSQSGGYFPKATNMAQLIWDQELAIIAQKHAEQCVFKHDCKECREVDRFTYVNQNYHTAKSTQRFYKPDWIGMINSWYREVKDFPVYMIKPFNVPNGPMTTHFTQVVWAETLLIGCGAAFFNNMENDNYAYPYAALYTCIYAPGGNVYNTEMYKVGGEPATSCSSGYMKSTQYAGLCANAYM